MSFLIGVTGQRDENTKQVVQFLLNSLNLIHINMRQPFYNALAQLMETTPLTAASMKSTDKVEPLNCTVAAFEREFTSAIFGLNKDFFTQTVSRQMNKSQKGFNQNLSDGFIVSGISRPEEADYIRAKGGVMVHVQGISGYTDFHPINSKLFDVTYSLKEAAKDRDLAMSLLISNVREAFKKAA